MIGDFLGNWYPWVLAFHIMSVIAWMAGLFYLPRLFVYHVERAPVGSETSETFKVMELKLLRVIINPAMISTWVFGLCLVFTPGVVDWGQVWPWVKAAMVLAMSGFHGWLATRRKEFARDENTRSGRAYRIANELPTLLMAVIVIMVVIKPF
jgi:putative membrane protein